jgi:hypothetical protein
MKGAHQVMVKVKNPTEQLILQLKNTRGVLEVNESQSGQLLVDVDELDPMTEKIAQVIIQNHSGLLELRPVEGNLEEIFIKLTSNV